MTPRNGPREFVAIWIDGDGDEYDRTRIAANNYREALNVGKRLTAARNQTRAEYGDRQLRLADLIVSCC
jgi:hypothetical protein